MKSLFWFSDLLAVAFVFAPDDKLNTEAREPTLETSTAELKVYLERVCAISRVMQAERIWCQIEGLELSNLLTRATIL